MYTKSKHLPTDEEYRKARESAYQNYEKIGKVYCPYLKDTVSFTSDGFRHIVYKSKGKKRHPNTQMLRFKLFNKAIKMVKESHIIQEYDAIETEMVVEDHNLKVSKLIKVEYFGFIGIVDGWKIKVILKKTGNGNPIFWSVIPNWITNKKRDLKKKYSNHSGNLEED